MKPVYQRIIDPNHGDCLKCCVCTLLDLDYEEVPNFVEEKHWFTSIYSFLEKLGYEFCSATYFNSKVNYLENPTIGCFEKPKFYRKYSLSNIKKEEGINGLFLASVYSPGFTNANEYPGTHLHQVICDKKYNIVFDPNPNYKGIIEYPYAQLIGYNGIRAIDIIRKINNEK